MSYWGYIKRYKLFSFLYDVLFAFSNLEMHLKDLVEILGRLSEWDFVLNVDKCGFGIEISIVVCTVSEKYISPLKKW